MELAWETLDEKIKNKVRDKKALHSSLGAAFFVDNYKGMEARDTNLEEYSNEHPIVRIHPETGKKILYVNWTYTKSIVGIDKKESDEILSKIVSCSLDIRPNSSHIRGDAETEAKACFVVNANLGKRRKRNDLLNNVRERKLFEDDD